MIDAYSLKARVYPMLILFSPLIIVGFFFSIQFDSIVHGFSSLGIVGILSYLFSQLGRDQGKKKEPELWDSWGGPVTTQILRLTDNTIDQYTKERYHKRLLQLCPTDVPELNRERNDIKASDEIYRAWTKFLISNTRNVKDFPLLLKENTSYGFRRNLWALKPSAITLVLSLIVVNYLVSFRDVGLYDPFKFLDQFWYVNSSLLLILVFWIFIINRDWVKVPALAYAQRLCESVDQLK